MNLGSKKEISSLLTCIKYILCTRVFHVFQVRALMPVKDRPPFTGGILRVLIYIS